MSVTVSVWLLLSRWCVEGEHDTLQDMMSVGSRSARCDGGVCRCVASCGMSSVSLHLPSIFSLGFMFKGISLENPLHNTKTTRRECVCKRERRKERDCLCAEMGKWSFELCVRVGVFRNYIDWDRKKSGNSFIVRKLLCSSSTVRIDSSWKWL